MVNLAPAVRLPGQGGGPIPVLIDAVKGKRVRTRAEPAGCPVDDMQSQFHGNYGHADGNEGKKDGSSSARGTSWVQAENERP